MQGNWTNLAPGPQLDGIEVVMAVSIKSDEAMAASFSVCGGGHPLCCDDIRAGALRFWSLEGPEGSTGAR